MTAHIDHSENKQADPGLNAAYAERREDYFEYARPEMLELFPADSLRVLDVGCGAGAFGVALKEKYGCEIWGVEPDLKSCEKSAAKLDRAVHGCFDEKLQLPFAYFDCIFFNDLLVHMIDPALALRLARKLLISGGKIAASIPNIAHFPTLWRLVVRGQWEYTERGILDLAYLHFFTRHSIRQLFENAGFSVGQLRGINEFLPVQPGGHRIWKFYRILSLLPGLKTHDMRYLQFAVLAVPRLRKHE
jgi:SAM-dependent methyltransferase